MIRFVLALTCRAKFFGVFKGLGCAEAHPYNIELGRRILRDLGVFGLVRE